MRGRENMRDLEINDLEFQTDSNGRQFVCLAKSLQSKNRKPSLTRKGYSDRKQSRMVADDSFANCPVQSLKLYLSKIPLSVSSLFPKPLTKCSATDKH